MRWAFFVQGRREPRSCKALHGKSPKGRRPLSFNLFSAAPPRRRKGMWCTQRGKSRNKGHHERPVRRTQSHEIWRNQTNPWMKGITSGCQEEAVSVSGVGLPPRPLPGRSKRLRGYRQYPAGRGHARLCNTLIIKYHFYKSVETTTFFGCVSTPRFITH